MTRISKSTRSSLPIVGLLALGLVACGGQSEAASKADAVSKTAVTAGGLTIDVLATQTWSGGFNGAVRITDTSFASPITSFQVVFKLAGGSVVGTGWNGTITGPDASGNYTAKNPDWLQYGPIRAGSTWDVGFNGSGTLSGSTIVSLTINGQAIPLGGDSPPTVSLASSSTAVTVGGTITLTATASDDRGVGKVEFYEGTNLLATDTAAPYTLSIGYTATGAHTYTARAYDTINQATTSNPVTVSVDPDDLPPVVSLASSSTSVTTASTFSLTATASDDGGITKVEFYDGTTLLGTDTTAPYTQPVNATAAMNGTHSYTARAHDTASPAHVTTSSAVTVVIHINPQQASVSLSASSSNVTTPSCITLTAAVTDTNAVVRVDFLEGTTVLGSDATAPYTWQICYTSANNGTHTYGARATDSASQIIVSAPIAVVVNIPMDTPPSVSLASSSTNVTTPTTITLTATAGDDHGVTKVEFYDGATLLASDATSPYTQQVSFTAANNGTHVMTARAYDTANQVTTSTAINVVVSIDATPPTCSLSASSSNVTAPGSVTLTATATDNVGVTRVEFHETALLGTDTSSPYTLVLSFTAANNGTHTYSCKAYDAAGNVSPPMTGIPVTVNIGVSADATLTVDTSASRHAISPYVYGYNAGRLADAPAGATYLRIGGNRWTAYNWTNNASNAGADWGPYSNDTYMGTPDQGPGAAIAPTIADAKASGVAALVTVPMQGYVSQAKIGNVPLSDPVTSWFVPNVPAKGSAFTLTPSPSSTTVYQDELANFIANRWGSGATPHLSLDNEPDLWGYVDASGNGTGTHPEVQRTQLSYAAFLQKSIASATAIKAAVPSALVYGPVSYGWNGMLSFQGAPDGTGATIDSSFLDYYLTSMASASTSRRLLDVLDVHWYSEAQSSGCSPSGVRVTNADNSDCVVAARVQAPRSLFDPTYVETSWITQWTTASSSMGQGIQLLPRLQAKISSKFPGTKLSVTEYNHGGEDHVSGAVAQADTLGILGREGAYAAAFWSINGNHTWAYAAWKAFRNYDGGGHNFGDTSVSASTTDLSHVSVYASVDAASANRLVLVIVHRPTVGTSGALDLKSRTVQVNWTHSTALRTARAWQLASASSPTWQTISVPAPTGNSITLTLPALSVTTVELAP